MSRPRDLQIWWVVLIAGGFWLVIWQHDQVAKLSKTVYTAAVAMTSGIRGVRPPEEATPAEAPDKSKRPASKSAEKGDF
jgi:hypothetical protein